VTSEMKWNYFSGRYQRPISGFCWSKRQRVAVESAGSYALNETQHWSQPGEVTHWPCPFFIHHWTYDRSGIFQTTHYVHGMTYLAFSALTLLVWRQEEHMTCKKLSTNWVITCWRAYLSAARVQMICIWCSWCHCHPIVSCIIKIQIG